MLIHIFQNFSFLLFYFFDDRKIYDHTRVGNVETTLLEVGLSPLSFFHSLNISDDMGKCWSKSNPANEPSDSQKPPESNRNKDLRAGEQQRHEVQRQQERRLTEEREAQAQHTGKGRRQAEEKLLMYVLGFVVLPSII